MSNVNNSIPEILCSIDAEFKEGENTDFLLKELNSLCTQKINVITPKFSDSIVFVLAKTNYKPSQYLDPVLSETLLLIKNPIWRLKQIVQKYHGRIWIDIAICKRDNFPCISFEGSNMQKIRELEAEISIDLYNC